MGTKYTVEVEPAPFSGAHVHRTGCVGIAQDSKDLRPFDVLDDNFWQVMGLEKKIVQGCHICRTEDDVSRS